MLDTLKSYEDAVASGDNAAATAIIDFGRVSKRCQGMVSAPRRYLMIGGQPKMGPSGLTTGGLSVMGGTGAVYATLSACLP